MCRYVQAGDTALGYDLASLQIVDPELEKYRRGIQLPDVLLVKKSYQEKRRKKRAKGISRAWKLQRMDVAEDDSAAAGHKAGAREAEKAAQDEELFMQELEEDEEVRAQVQIFRDHQAAAGGAAGGMGEETDGDDDGDDAPEVPIECLLDEMTLRGGVDEEDEDDDDDGEYGDEDEEMAD